MNLQNVFTKMDKFLQEHLKIWDYKIPSHFPDNLDKQRRSQAHYSVKEVSIPYMTC